eukprot:Skav214191  [mRNA]  locus=scaffold3641:106935:108103:+ [translate_table: standard]
MCFEPTGTASSTQWVARQLERAPKGPVYEGEGKGSTEITYVGDGKGAYSKEVVTEYTGYRVRPWCWGLLLLIPLLFFLFYWLYPRADRGQADVEPPKPLHDCFTGYQNWQQLWSEDHAAFCCAQYGRGCQEYHYEYEYVAWIA